MMMKSLSLLSVRRHHPRVDPFRSLTPASTPNLSSSLLNKPSVHQAGRFLTPASTSILSSSLLNKPSVSSNPSYYAKVIFMESEHNNLLGV
ncbi:unnamed protein product [Arabis nemorensis]|uniref:Uncharacterized protein n=1 Tax=Arabis nemorensis TaxID=586526 RepID=A0A565B2Y3_9BRAS|nr:unnamed protein product [Arabis nemorensis]